jgi:hypothetical protein
MLGANCTLSQASVPIPLSLRLPPSPATTFLSFAISPHLPCHREWVPRSLQRESGPGTSYFYWESARRTTYEICLVHILYAYAGTIHIIKGYHAPRVRIDIVMNRGLRCSTRRGVNDLMIYVYEVAY